MTELQRLMLDGRLVTVRFTSRLDGNLGVNSPLVGQVRTVVDPRPWTWLSQVHGDHVVDVSAGGQHAGAVADGAITRSGGCVLSVQGADCAPLVFWSPQGVVGVAHAGWRGALEGIVERTVDKMRFRGATRVYAVIGPHIHPSSYEFAPSDLQIMINRFGAAAQGRTADDKPALDMGGVLRSAIEMAEAEIDVDVDVCTSDSDWYSHRVRADEGRQAALVVIEEASVSI